MDLLKRELERKKRKVEKAKSSAGGRRFFRASELRRQEEEEEDRRGEQEKQSRKRKQRGGCDDEDEGTDGNKNSRLEVDSGNSKKSDDVNLKNFNGKAGKDEKAIVPEGGTDRHDDSKTSKMSPEEITQRLRSLGHPIKLFGESVVDRLNRLKQALDVQKNLQAGLSEMEEFRLGRGHGIRNPFLEKEKDDKQPHDHLEEGPPSDEAAGAETADGKKKNDGNENDDDADDPHKRVYKYFKGLLNQWEEDLNQRPERVKKSVAGRNETKTLKQCKDYIRPMFKLCKSRRMDEIILSKLNKIVAFCLEEEFVKAHDTYIDISIGRAAWPIGVTMVGIHARTGRAKIESSNVAHVMNSELQRKYLTSVKRLMSYAQKKSNADPSKKVLN
jgi:pre-mRNA-splicing factor 18